MLEKSADSPIVGVSSYTDVDTLIQRFAEYAPDCDKNLIRKAYSFAEDKHSGQSRHSGAPYFSHPVAVAEILLDHKYGEHCIITALLHDTIEDCEGVDEKLIRQEFGEDIASLVQSVTNVSQGMQKPGFELWLTADTPPNSPVSKDFRNIIRILYNSANDGRAMAVKLADRLHNMKTINSCEPSKQRRIAIETLTVYAPLARSFGMHYWRKELENKAFKVLFPEKWKEMRRLYASARGARSDRSVSFRKAHKIEDDLKDLMAKHNFNVTIKSRVKEPYSVWRKMEKHQITKDYQDWLLDVYGFQVIVNSEGLNKSSGNDTSGAISEIDAIAEVYRALGVIHLKWQALPGRFKDYISSPKLNGYRSIHTTVAIKDIGNAEIQVKTEAMHREAEYGTAIHWMYRQQIPPNAKARAITEKWGTDILNSHLGSHLKDVEKCKELFSKEIEESIVCFNDKGQTVRLPKGSTALDFAYIDDPQSASFAGNLVRIDKEFKDLVTVLKHGQLVQISKHNEQQISQVWLKMANSDDVKKLIFRDLGMIVLNKEFGPNHPLQDSLLDKAALQLKFTHWEEMVTWLGECVYGSPHKQEGKIQGQPDLQVQNSSIQKYEKHREPITALKILELALPEEHRKRKINPSNTSMRLDIEIDGDRSPEIARCCMPLPGEMVIGLVDDKGKASLHAVDCLKLSKKSSELMRWSDVLWQGGASTFLAGLIVKVVNSVGALSKICESIGRQNTNISDLIFIERNHTEFKIFFELQVSNREHLANIITAIKGQAIVNDVTRCRNLDYVKCKHRVGGSTDKLILN